MSVGAAGVGERVRGEIERGKEAPVRFEAGLTGNTVKAARIESKASAGELRWLSGVDIECNHRYVGVIDETEVVGGRTRSRKVAPRGWVIGEGLRW